MIQPAKSLKKLRSATSAYLEDGGTLLHSIDMLLRDLQRAIKELDTREQAIDEREKNLEARELVVRERQQRLDACLDQILDQTQLAAKASSDIHSNAIEIKEDLTGPVTVADPQESESATSSNEINSIDAVEVVVGTTQKSPVVVRPNNSQRTKSRRQRRR